MRFDPDATMPARAPPRYRVRWIIFAYLFAFSFIAYLQRQSFSIAAVQIMPELGYSQITFGWLLTASLVTYTVFQLPGGVFGEWLGARKALVIISLVAFAAAVATPLAPLVLTGAALFTVLVLARLVLGMAQAPLFPMTTGVIAAWFPVGQWGFPNGLLSTGYQLGSAAAAPLIAILMEAHGWKHAMLWTTLPALVVIALWAWYGRNSPAEHPRVSATELAEVSVNPTQPAAAVVGRETLRRVLGNRSVLILTISYTLMNYSFYLLYTWCFIYLVQERHLSVLESGWLTTLPFISAGIGAAVGGKLSDSLAIRYGLRVGYRMVPLVALPVAGLLLFVGVNATNAYWAVTALSLAFASIEMTEGAFAAATISAEPENSMAAFGVVNTGGNLGGVIGTPLVAVLSAHGMWTAAFLTGTGLAILSGILWLWVDTSRVIAPTDG